MNKILLEFARAHKSALLALLTGLLVFLSFPKPNLFPLAWLSLMPLIYVSQTENGRRSFLFGVLSGLTASAGMFYWIYSVVKGNTGSTLQGLVCLAALSLYLSLYYGAWSYALNRIKDSVSLMRFSIFAASLWVSLEYLKTYLFTGFPFGTLGYSQWAFLPLIQVSEFTGVFGISFLIVIVNVGLYRVVTTKRILTFALLSFGLSACVVLGVLLLNKNVTAPPPYMKVAVVQGNIDQYKKWDSAYRNEIIDGYSELVRKAAASNPDLIIWPETAVPGFLPADPYLFSWISRLAQETSTFQIIGAPYFNGGGAYYNASFLFGPEGEVLNWHKKNHLVPFGEFVPFRKLLLPFFKVFDTMGDYTPGSGPSIFSVKSVLWGPTICSENFFGGIARGSVLCGAEILLNQTNDAWFYRTSAADQHFTMNVFRAVENRRSVIVSANTGYSGVIDPSGRISAKTKLFKTDFFVTRVGPMKKVTFYTRWGDLFAALCVLGSLFTLVNTAFGFMLVERALAAAKNRVMKLLEKAGGK
jgi:apolipoprotein N-acyltransferase